MQTNYLSEKERLITMSNIYYPLDNAAKIYTAAMNKKWNSVFNVSVYLKIKVNPALLKLAVRELAPRFPTFYTQLHKGFFWDYLIPATDFDIVSEATDYPCRPIAVGQGKKPMFRVLYSDNKITAEFFHSVTDGTGAITYLKTLTARYIELAGGTVEKTNGVLDPNEPAQSNEMADAFQGVYKKSKRQSRNEKNAYQYKPKREKNFLKTTNIILPIDKLKENAKEKYGCTVTEYLAGIYAYAFVQQYKSYENRQPGLPVKISVPVNLRPYYNSKTLRNFATFVNVCVYPNKIHSLADSINAVKKEMRLLIQMKKLQKTVSQNVAEEKMLITRIAPNILKKLVMKFCFHEFGEKKYTSPFSNLGFVDVPETMKPYIDRFESVIGETPANCVYCTAVGFGNKLSVTVSSVTKENSIEKYFIDSIKTEGIISGIKNAEKQKKNIAA